MKRGNMETNPRTERLVEFNNAIREYGVESASALKLAYLASMSADYDAARTAKHKAANRVRNAWAAMVVAGDPETKH